MFGGENETPRADRTHLHFIKQIIRGFSSAVHS